MLDKLPLDVLRRILEMAMCSVLPVGIFPNNALCLWDSISKVPQLWRAWRSGGDTAEQRFDYFSRVMCETLGSLALATSTMHGMPELFGAVHKTLGSQANSTILHTAMLVASWSNNVQMLKYMYYRRDIRADAIPESVYAVCGGNHKLCLLSAYPTACKWIFRMFPNHTTGGVCLLNDGTVFPSPADFAVCSGNMPLCHLLLQAMTSPQRRLDTLVYVCGNLDIMHPKPTPRVVTNLVMRNCKTEDLNIVLTMCMCNESADSKTHVMALIRCIMRLTSDRAREQLVLTLFNRVGANDVQHVNLLLNTAPEFVHADSVHPSSRMVPLSAARSDEMVDLLVNVHGANARFIGWDGSSIAHMMAATTAFGATAPNSKMPFARLKHNGCDLTKTTPGGNTALHTAVFFGNTAAVLSLLESEPGLVHVRRPRGHAPVFYVMDPECLRLFPQEVIRMRDASGSTILHHAAMLSSDREFEELLTIAIAAGVDPTEKNDAGMTAMDAAAEHSRFHAMVMLARHSALRS